MLNIKVQSERKISSGFKLPVNECKTLRVIASEKMFSGERRENSQSHALHYNAQATRRLRKMTYGATTGKPRRQLEKP